MEEFDAAILHADLVELPSSGPWFTWSNSQEGDRLIMRRLDRVLVNEAWLTSFPESRVRISERRVSDHCPLIVSLGSTGGSRPRVFRFFNFWAEADGFVAVVREFWQAHPHVSPLVSLGLNLRALKPILRRRFGRAISVVQQEVRDARVRMLEAQQALAADPSCSVLQEIERGAVGDFWVAARTEEASLRQKSRVLWLALGDQNSGFFHRCIRQRRMQNCFASVLDGDGVPYSSPSALASDVVAYFQGILGTESVGYRDLTAQVADIVDFRWPPEFQEGLSRLPSGEEIRSVLFSMSSGKAPGPDGFTVAFFKSAWSVVGEDFCRAVRHFFDTSYLPPGCNATAVTLIPKVPSPTGFKDFRPISCCNVLYKCISKLLSERLKEGLPLFVSRNQSAFVAGRSIVDNILLCQELVGGYHLNRGLPRCVLKIDLQKAYDSVHWDFLFGLLLAIGTPVRFVSWVRACVTSPMYSVVVNGGLEGFFPGRRGLRQGDPLSPYLFVMVMEVLSCMLNRPLEGFRFHPRCATVRLNHLCFADDLMLFSAGDSGSVGVLRDVLHRFGQLSGLVANPGKSLLFCAGMSEATAGLLGEILGFSIGALPVRYLGLPLLSSRLTARECRPLIERVLARVRSWSACALSFAGRLQLIRSVLRSLQVFWMSVFLLPTSVIAEIDRICRGFLWRGRPEGLGGARVAWEEVCLPWAEGGLGLHHVSSWNAAALMRHLWNLLTQAGSLWVAWMEAYVLRGRSLWVARLPSVASWCLKSLFKVRARFRELVHVVIGNGERCSVWLDPWLPCGPLVERFGARIVYDAGSSLEARVASFIHAGAWRWPRTSLGMLEAWPLVLAVGIHTHREDRFVWRPGEAGGFSVASAYGVLRPSRPVVGWGHVVQFRGWIPRHSFIAWLAIRDRLPTRDRLVRWGDPEAPTACLLCLDGLESREHLFLECPFGRCVWSGLLDWAQEVRACGDWATELAWVCQVSLGGGPRCRVWRLVWCAFLYHIWRERNGRLHAGPLRSPLAVLCAVQSDVFGRAVGWPSAVVVRGVVRSPWELFP